jgi:DnaJ-class molecular chaperone
MTKLPDKIERPKCPVCLGKGYVPVIFIELENKYKCGTDDGKNNGSIYTCSKCGSTGYVKTKTTE